MKRALIVIIFLILFLTACGEKATQEKPTNPEANTATSAPPATAVTASSLPANTASWAWEPLKVNAPTATLSMQTVYDSQRKVIVLFGGRDDNNRPLAETWEFNGTTWQMIRTAHTPPARIWHSLAYDSARQVVLLFGGDANTSERKYLNDTWEYDGTDWKQIAPPTSPAPHGHGASLVYDTCRQRAVLFGGESADGNATWEYDGSTWSKIQTSVSPPKRWLAPMVFDPNRCRAILFGGGSSADGLNDTWEYDGQIWTRINTSTSPSLRHAAGLAYHPATRTVILFGGYLTTEAAAANDIWSYDGKNWSQLFTDRSAPIETQHTLVNWDVNNSLVMLGGGQTWALTTTTNAPRPTTTAEATAPAMLDCTNGWTRLSPDHYARVLGGANDPPNRVRSGASKQAEIIAQIYPQDIVKVLEGPVCADGLVFWRVEHTNIPGGSGWTAEGDLSEYYLEPYVAQADTVTLSAYGVSFTVPGSWSDIPEAEIVPAGHDEMGRTWPQYTLITLSTYPAESDWAPQIYVYKTAELTNTFYGPTSGAPALVRAHEKEVAFGNRQVVENGNAHPVFSNRLTYYYQGTSADGLYTFIVVMPINAPFLPQSDKNMSLPANGIPFKGMETWDYNNWKTYYVAVQTQLEQAPASLFTPALDILDALAASLTVNAP